MNQLHHFYHIYCDGNWKQTVNYHISTLITFGLYDSLTTFNVGLIGSEQNRNTVKDYLDSKNIEYIICVEKDKGWEQETLKELLNFSQSNTGYVYYAHSKNATNVWLFHEKIRILLEHFSTRKWKDCLQKLNNYSIVGCFYSNLPFDKGHYVYNYWWTKLDYIKDFDKPSLENRFYSSYWLNQLKEIVDKNNNCYKAFDFCSQDFES
jgi:hypothetical protein